MALPIYRKDLPKYTAQELGRAVAFPYPNPEPRLSRAMTTSGYRDVLNIGSPTMQNDPTEYLRSALVASDWASVERYLAWLAANGATFKDIAEFPIGAYKYIVSNGRRIYLPFSDDEYAEIFRRFRRFDNGDPASERCIRASVEASKKFRDSALRGGASANIPFVFNIGICPTRGTWWKGFLIMAAAVAALYGGAVLINAALGTSAAGASAASAASATSAAGGAAGGVTGAGGMLATSVLPDLSVLLPQISAGAAGAIETVTISAAALPTLSAGAAGALAAGAAGAAALASGTGGSGASVAQSPTPAGAQPSAPETSTSAPAESGATAKPSAVDQILGWIKQQGLDWTKEQIAAFIAGQLGRPLTADETAAVAQPRPRASDSLPLVPLAFAGLAILLFLSHTRRRT